MAMRGVWLMLAGLAIAGLAMVLGFVVAPGAKGFEGDSYRIIFWHVPAAWTSFLTFGVLLILLSVVRCTNFSMMISYPTD